MGDHTCWPTRNARQREPDPMLSRWLPMIMTRPLSFARPFANTLTERLSASRVMTGQSRTAADAAHLSFFFKRPDSMSEGKTVPRKVLYGPRSVRARSLARSAVRTDPLPVGGGGGHRRPTERPTDRPRKRIDRFGSGRRRRAGRGRIRLSFYCRGGRQAAPAVTQ